MADFLQELLRLLEEGDDTAPPPTPPPPPRRSSRNPNRNSVPTPHPHNDPYYADALVPARHSQPQNNPAGFSFHNSGTQNLKGLINNTGYTSGNGNGSIVFGNSTFDGSRKT
ncbi:hypothetical protein O6P43_021846 [Quillaja saponaria]|uniref:Uncharacterized protein n=1 Tax=Quillaja saponaria TaxID=32244 RepID=A0AAD7LCJ9_QUISA|nr:hypothetical protein O6P43_021846 [Quillaja saponaria]